MTQPKARSGNGDSIQPEIIADRMARVVAAQRSGNLVLAGRICTKLLKDHPNDDKALHLMGVILHHQGHNDAAIPTLMKAIECNPCNLSYYKNLILIFQQVGKLGVAQEYMRAAIKIPSSDGNTYHALGNLFYREGRLRTAIQCYRKTISIDPAAAEAHHNLGGALHALGRLEEAIVNYRCALGLNPLMAETHYSLGNVHKDQNNLDEALSCYKAAVKADPRHQQAMFNMGNAYRDGGNLEKAMPCFQRCIQIDPDNVDAHYNLGNVFYRQFRVKQAMAAYARVLELNPEHKDSYNNLGCLFKDLGDFKQATIALEKAVSIDPNFTTAYVNLGNVYKEQNQFTESIGCYQKALDVAPDHTDALNAMGIVLKKYGRFQEGLSFHQRAIASCPGISPAWWYYYLALPILYENETEIEDYRRRFADGLDKIQASLKLTNVVDKQSALAGIGSTTNFYLQYQGGDDTQFQSQYGRLVHKIMCANFPQWSQRIKMPGLRNYEKIRIGYVSSFMQSHTIGTFLMGWLDHHDRNKFELYCYHIGAQSDAMTEKFRQTSDHFHQIHGNLSLVAGQIRNDNLHILTFTDIGMYAPATQLAGLHLAPVQCKGWGHPVTTGLPSIDYYISSDLMETEDAQQFYTEKLIRLPNLALAFQKPTLPSPLKTRTDFGLREDDFIYFTSQSLFKYLPQYDEIYPRIAHQVGNAKFVFIANASELVTSQFRQRLRNCFAMHGLNADDYCVFHSRLNYADFLNLNNVCDVLLDTLSWSGGKTTLEGIGCGLPVVTLPGGFMRGRHAYAMLKMMGVEETIAQNLADYIDIAVRLGTDRQYCDHIKERMWLNRDKLYNDRKPIRALDNFYSDVVKSTLKDQGTGICSM